MNLATRCDVLYNASRVGTNANIGGLDLEPLEFTAAAMGAA